LDSASKVFLMQQKKNISFSRLGEIAQLVRALDS
jgi:hypothetical protein